MAKASTTWTSPGNSLTTSGGGSLLLETGGHLLLESSGGRLLLEDSVVVNKEQTSWAAGVDHLATAWSGDGFTSFASAGTVQRKQQDGTVRKQQDTITRLQQPSVATSKAATVWSDL